MALCLTTKRFGQKYRPKLSKVQYRAEMIERIGYFHFAQDWHDPLGALDVALSRLANLEKCLIVLPEAFNNGRPYYDNPRSEPLFAVDAILAHLREISTERGAVFVVGLLN